MKPPKRFYPDYYVLIKHPIALDVIKREQRQNLTARLENFGGYSFDVHQRQDI